MRARKRFWNVVACVLATYGATVLLSCDPCSNLDCVSDNYNGQFRIVNNAMGNDLLFGANPTYNKNRLQFYSLKGTDTTFFEHELLKFGGAGYDSIVIVRFNTRPDLACMRLSDGDIDTLNISYNEINTRCCGKITEIASFRFNNGVAIPGDKGTQELRK